MQTLLLYFKIDFFYIYQMISNDNFKENKQKSLLLFKYKTFFITKH